MKNEDAEKRFHGLVAGFDSEEQLVRAVREAVKQGLNDIEAFSPYSIHELKEILPLKNKRIQLCALAGALLGLLGGYLLQFYANAISYPLVVSARPFNSVPSFIQVTFEMLVLGGSFGAFFGLFFFTGLPALYDPIFELPQFQGASRDRFFLLVKGSQTPGGLDRAREFFKTQNIAAHEVYV